MRASGLNRLEEGHQGSRCRGWRRQSAPIGGEQFTGQDQAVAVADGKEAKVTHFDQALRQHMLQKATDKAEDRHGDLNATFGLILLIPEGDLVLL